MLLNRLTKIIVVGIDKTGRGVGVRDEWVKSEERELRGHNYNVFM